MIEQQHCRKSRRKILGSLSGGLSPLLTIPASSEIQFGIRGNISITFTAHKSVFENGLIAIGTTSWGA